MGKKKSREQLEAENEYLRRGAIADGLVKISNQLIKWAAIVIIAAFFLRAIEALAGKQTNADLAFLIFTDLGLNHYSSYAVGAIGFGYGLFQRNLRKKNIFRLSKRIQDLEVRIDPTRSSSQLTRHGETREEDKV